MNYPDIMPDLSGISEAGSMLLLVLIAAAVLVVGEFLWRRSR